MRFIFSLLIIASIPALSRQAIAVTIDFQSLEVVSAGEINQSSPYDEDGYRITLGTSANPHRTLGTLHPLYTGSTALNMSFFAFQSFTLTRIDGRPFNLRSIDLAEYTSSGAPDATFTTDTGHSQTFTLDAIPPDNTVSPPVTGVETFTFDEGFQGVTSVTWSPFFLSNYQFDNIVVNLPAPSAIPVGGNLILTVMAILLGIAGVRAQRKFKS